MKTKLLFIFFCLVITFAHAQRWDRTYNISTHARAIVLSDNGSFLVAGWNFYMKIDPAGNVLWSVPNQTDYTSIIRSSDGNYLLTGADNNLTKVTKIDSAGNVLFDQTYLSGFKSRPSQITELDGHYLITGFVSDGSNSGMPADSGQTFLVKTNTSGTLVWSMIYNQHSAVESSTGYGVKLDTDQNYLLWGNRRISSNHGGQLIKVNALSGDTIWTLQMNSGPYNSFPPTPILHKGVNTADGGYISSGEGINGTFDYNFTKYNSSYQVEWSKVINIEDQDHTYNIKTVTQTSDGGYITGGINFAVAPSSVSLPYVAKCSSTGDTLWTSQIATSAQFEMITAVAICADGYIFGSSMGVGGFRLIRTDELGGKATNTISGQFYIDANGNCMKDPGEKPAPFGKVIVQPGNLVAGADTAGNYSLPVRTGTYSVTTVSSDLWQVDCAGSMYNITFSNPYTDYQNADIALSPVKNCSRLIVDVSTPFQRRCFKNNYTVTYANEGTVVSPNTSLELEFSPHTIPLSFSTSYSQIGNKYVIPVGTLNPGDKGKIRIIDSVSCSIEAIGATACVTAKINPGNNCEPVLPNWDGSSVQVNGKCQGDTAVKFVITNKAKSGSGDMEGTSIFRVYRDDVLSYEQDFQIMGEDSLVVIETTDGSTIRLEADQRPDHPGHSMPKVSIEGCSTLPVAENSRGFIAIVPVDDLDDTIEIDCRQIVGSYDPNDKSVQPTGMTSNHFIRSTNELEYMIRFQNTGTDTAFTVKIIDTISTELDLSTLVMAGSSHNYQYNIRDNQIMWIFNNILLPDSNVNLLGSNGFVKYKIKPKSTISQGITIHNTAHIYFDYNFPVATNTATVRVNDAYRTTSVKQVVSVLQKKNDILVYPNPTSTNSTITASGLSDGMVILYNASGHAVLQMSMVNGKAIIDKSRLENGIYLVRVMDSKGFSGAAKMIVE